MKAPIAALLAFALGLIAALPALSQAVAPPPSPPVAAEDGRQTLEDILARQRGEADPRQARDMDSASGAVRGLTGQLGTRGGPSDAEVWEALRFGTADVKVSAGGPVARVLVQDGGMWWQEVRKGPLATWGGYALLGALALLAAFYLVRGRIRISHGRSGVRILRFNLIERFAHWLLAGSFILLGVTGLISLFGRKGLIPWMGHEAYAALAHYSKLIHDNVAWAFMVGLVLVFLFWVVHNIPSRLDLVWIAKGGGIVGKGHPPAKKFNFGQKLVFWAVIVFGGSIAVSGVSLLFPYQFPLFAHTFGVLNDLGAPELVGLAPLPEQLAPQEEMQFAQLWHSMVAFALMVIILAHIYIGTLGMEGAFEAMGSGKVDLNWAKEHHSLWVEKVMRREAAKGGDATPAE